jgi:D-alanine transaminase
MRLIFIGYLTVFGKGKALAVNIYLIMLSPVVQLVTRFERKMYNERELWKSCMNHIAYVNGEFLPLQDAKVSILDRGFLFADGIYEVSAVLDGRLVDKDAHMQRLLHSVSEIQLALPETVAGIIDIQIELIRRNSLTEGIVYIEVTRGVADRDFMFPKDARPTLVIFTQEKRIVDSPAAKTGIAVKSVPDIRWARRDIKSVGLLAQVLAKQAAQAANCQEAWMVEDGFVTEGGSSSAFIITTDRVLVTRPNSSAILPGCTRKATVKLAQEHQIRVEERPFTLAEAQAAAEAFMTSASAFVTPVVHIDGRDVGNGRPGPLTSQLREIYIEFFRTTA